MQVLVTGANGFLGSWLVRKLLDQGLAVSILHRPNSDLSDLTGCKFESCIGDVTDAASVERACRNQNTVFHLAGVIGYSRAQRKLMERVNVQGTAHVVDAVLKNSVQRLVHVSSVTAVGASHTATPLNEESPYAIADLNLGYFETKRQGELLVQHAVRERGLNAVIVNPSTIYGAGDARKGSRGTQFKVAQGKIPFYTSGGVSAVSVENVVAAMLQAWRVGRTGERYILSGDNITIKELFHIIARCAGVQAPKVFLPNPVVHAIGKLGDTLEKFGKKGPLNSENAWTATLYHWFDSSKAQRELGLHKESAEDSIRRSVEWCKKNGLL